MRDRHAGPDATRMRLIRVRGSGPELLGGGHGEGEGEQLAQHRHAVGHVDNLVVPGSERGQEGIGRRFDSDERPVQRVCRANRRRARRGPRGVGEDLSAHDLGWVQARTGPNSKR